MLRETVLKLIDNAMFALDAAQMEFALLVSFLREPAADGSDG